MSGAQTADTSPTDGAAGETARVRALLAEREAELAERAEHQDAIAQVMREMGRSPSDAKPVFDAIARAIRRLCDAAFSGVFYFDGELLHAVSHEMGADGGATIDRLYPMRPDRTQLAGRAVLAGKTVEVADLLADVDYPKEIARAGNWRSMISVPLVDRGRVVGALNVARTAPGGFADRHVRMLETFADQAVIAIENARLLDELQRRQQELTRNLSYQTGLSDVLGVISHAQTDLGRVLQTIADTAARICETRYVSIYLKEGDDYRLQVMHGLSEAYLKIEETGRFRPSRGTVVGRTVLTREVQHIHDLQADPEYTLKDEARIGEVGTVLAVPMVRASEVIGVLIVAQRHVAPFRDDQIEMVSTFASQASIAITNARLFETEQARTREVTEALEYQSASAEVLELIAHSPSDLMPILQTIASTASRLSDSPTVSIFLRAGDEYRLRITHGLNEAYAQIENEERISVGRGTLVGRVALTKTAYHIPDFELDADYERKEHARVGGLRTMLGVPLMRSHEVVGVIALAKQELAPFTQKQIEIVTSFAAQATIAINNARLFEELQARTREVQESLEYQTATSEVLRTVSRSAFDLQAVLQASIGAAVRFAQSDMGSIFQLEDGVYRWRVGSGLDPAYQEIERRHRIAADNTTLVGRAALAGHAVHVHDAWSDPGYVPRDEAQIGNVRTMLGVPLMRDGQALGVFALARARLEPFSEREISVVSTFASQAAIAIENARLFNEIKDKSRELELASQHKSQFLANMSHELRTPLNAILGYTELMQDGIYGALPQKAADVLGRVQSNGRHLLGLINQVLDLSKIEAGQLKLNLADYSLGAVVETVVAATEALATEKGLAIKTEIAPGLPLGVGDEQRIAQVLLNLVGNAIKFTEMGEVRIMVGAFAGRFQVAVADTGPGIPMDEVDRIFQEFHQVDSSNTKAKGGTGLGLAIAKRITALHGGRIWVESVHGQGATFKIEMPIQAIEVEEGIAQGAAE